ncbi:MAG: MMPL family transporter [Pseudomonadales bacterium]|nr:MMPL family transporter [Pseudomonadales bacterium]
MNKLLAGWLIQKRWGLAFISFVLLAFLAIGCKDLYLESSYRIFFDQNDPFLEAFDQIEDTYSREDNLIFVIAPESQQVFSQQTLALVLALTEKSWLLPYSHRVDSITNYQHTTVDGDELFVGDLIEDLEALSVEQMLVRRQIAIEEPEILHKLVSEKTDVTAVYVQLQFPDKGGANEQEVEEIVLASRQLRDELLELFPESKIYLTGNSVITNAFQESAFSDGQTLIPLMFVVVSLLMAYLLGSIPAAFISMVIVGCSVLFAMGAGGWLGFAINQVNVSAPTIILTLAVCDCVHLLSTYLQRLASGDEKVNAMRVSLEQNIKPIFITSFTTAIGFFSVNFSDSPPLRELGTLVGLGVIAAWFFTMALLPALALRWVTKAQPRVLKSQMLSSWACSVVLNHPKKLFWTALPIILLLLGFIQSNELNDDTIAYFDKGVSVRDATDFTEQHLTGVHSLVYSLDSGADNGINQPEFLRKVEAFSEWLRTQPHVAHVATYTDTLKRLNRTLHSGEQQWYRLPVSAQLASQYQLLYEMSLPYGLDLNNQISFDRSALKINISLRGLKSQGMVAFERKAANWLENNAPELATTGSSISIIFAHLGQNNIRSMVEGSVISLFLISICLIFALGSLRYGIIATIPNIAPAAIAFGIWGLLVQEINMAASIIFSVSLGIVVDDTVHFLSKYIHATKALGLNAEQSITYSFDAVGGALITTSVVLSLGFFVLALSSFAINSILGLMVGMTIIIAILFDFFILPVVLLMVKQS